MSEVTGSDKSVYADGYSGFPVQTQQIYGRRPGTVEWLLDAVERHATAEQDALDEYERIGAVSGDPVVALVMRIILDDEERHHGLLKRMEASLGDALNWTHSPNALPETVTPQEAAPSDLKDSVHALIEEERTGSKYLQNLARQEKDVDDGLHSLLLEMMSMDSEKHARLLQFVERRLEKRKQANLPA